MKPLIALTCGYLDAGKTPALSHMSGTKRVLSQAYAEALRQAGGIPVLALTGEDSGELARRCDALLLTGGEDIQPSRYGQQALPACEAPDLLRDSDEFALFFAFVKTGKPILGVCRGLQLLNVALGGTLWQDIPSQLGANGHSDGARHAVELSPGTLLRRLLGVASPVVNSYHHQAVDRLGDGLRANAAADGLIEGAEHQTLPILGVQWHPERMTAGGPDASGLPDMAGIFDWLINEASGRTR